VLSIQPTVARENVIYSDLVRMTDQLAESREQRLAESAKFIVGRSVSGVTARVFRPAVVYRRDVRDG